MNGISEIDKNLKIDTLCEDGLKFLMPDCGLFEIGGFPHYEENGKEFLRFPKSRLNEVRENAAALLHFTASGVIRFMTNSSKIAIKAKFNTNWDLDFMPRSGMLGFDIYLGSVKDKLFVKNFSANYKSEYVGGVSDISPYSTGMKEISIYFPLYTSIETMYIGVDENATVNLPVKRDIEKPIVFYGSSITNGGCVDRPGNTYVNIISRWLDANVYNLGLPGNALGEKIMAEVISDIDMSALVLDYDHNAPNPMHLSETHYPFYKYVRNKNKDIPIILMSKPDVKSDECQIRKKIIKNTYKKAKSEGDNNIYFIDGERLFDGLGYDDCTVDRCHPNALGAFRIAQGLYKVLSKVLDVEEKLF